MASSCSSGTISCSPSSCATFSGFFAPVAVAINTTTTTTSTTPWIANSGTGTSYSPGIVEITGSSLCVSGNPGACPEIKNFTKPVGLAFDSNGNLWVIDAGNNTTTKFSASAISGPGCGNSSPCIQFTLSGIPEGIATDSLGNVWISLQNGQVIEYKP